ncbi:pyridoxal 5'-phosphate synthase [Streptomyces sp. NPDC057694]|uniref:pyridoxine/pyridoxamine 5'-phosphate oxidase n=1 Tax=Streptomyces sp. NPDC057694 TaxID=3346216 RepID=UPI00367F55E4
MDNLRQLLRGLEVFAGELPVFDPVATPETPHELFADWLLGAVEAGVREPHAMTLSTAGEDGNPQARVLILKAVTAGGWQFASDGGSVKARDLAERPYAALTFYWPSLARQVRVRGPVVREPADAGAADFRARSEAARAEALLGRQSRPLDSLGERDAAVRESRERLAREPGLVAPGWALHTVCPETVEFWQGDKDRRHTRLTYLSAGGDGGWRKQLLWP